MCPDCDVEMAELLADQPDGETAARIDPTELEVYVCGINAMVYSLETAVRRLGVPGRHLHCEGYG
jgi:predicted ferric reductase